jgi:hypothetical protein
MKQLGTAFGCGDVIMIAAGVSAVANFEPGCHHGVQALPRLGVDGCRAALWLLGCIPWHCFCIQIGGHWHPGLAMQRYHTPRHVEVCLRVQQHSARA